MSLFKVFSWESLVKFSVVGSAQNVSLSVRKLRGCLVYFYLLCQSVALGLPASLCRASARPSSTGLIYAVRGMSRGSARSFCRPHGTDTPSRKTVPRRLPNWQGTVGGGAVRRRRPIVSHITYGLTATSRFGGVTRRPPSDSKKKCLRGAVGIG